MSKKIELRQLKNEASKVKKGDCPTCERTDVKFCKGVCVYCYQSEYIKKRKEERKQYEF